MNANDLTFNDIFRAYYSLFRADSDVPAEGDDEYTVGMRLANEAVNYWSNYDGTYWNQLFDTNQVDGSGSQTISTGTTIYTAPTNFREAGGFVKVLDVNGNEQARYPIIEPHEAQFKGTNTSYCFFTSHPQYYATGTASQTGTTVTGVGTTWTSDMVGMQIVFATGQSATITVFNSVTDLTVSVSQTVASTTYHIDSSGYKLHINPAPTSNLNGGFIDYVYYKHPTLFTNGLTKTEMANPYFVVHRMLGMQFRAARNPYYQSAIKDSENTIRVMQIDNNSGSWANPWSLGDESGTEWGN